MNQHKHEISERPFMQALLKHTGIALAILVPLAAYSAFSQAATGMTTEQQQARANALSQQINAIPTVPHSVSEVDLNKYAGQWYEIARLPMYFQRKCVSDVTATYRLNHDDAGDIKSVDVVNQCRKEDSSMMSAEGVAKPANNTGSEFKVTFLPSWIRWLPVGKADYWVLELDDNYQSALVGTPDNKYLWVLSRKPTLSQETFNKYKARAQAQGYDVSQLQITTHTGTPNTLVAK